MKCNHKDADGASAIMKCKCGICGVDNKKIVKQFIASVCDSVDYNLRVKNHNTFLFNFSNDRIAYLIADKGIEKRISKKLLKKFDLYAEVIYEMKPSCNTYLDAELSIKITRRYLNELSFPSIREWPNEFTGEIENHKELIALKRY